jgi:SAM-dependent methyltransferase
MPVLREPFGKAVQKLIERLELNWLPDDLPDTDVFHSYIPLPVSAFLQGYEAIEPSVPGRRFLDVGCGIGTKLLLMHLLGWEVAGIELYEPYARAARELIPEASITVADVFDLLTPATFADADVVYMYRPCRFRDRELALERQVLGLLRPGAVLWLPAHGELGGAFWRRGPEV